jgi:sulfate transport system permease protein
MSSPIGSAMPKVSGSRAGRYGLRTVALVYLALILLLPVGMVFFRTFENGLQPVLQALTDPETLHALYLTVVIAAIAVPLNTVFGVFCAAPSRASRF